MQQRVRGARKRVTSSMCARYLPAAMVRNLLQPGKKVAGWHGAQGSWGLALCLQKRTEERVKKKQGGKS